MSLRLRGDFWAKDKYFRVITMWIIFKANTWSDITEKGSVDQE